MYLLLIILNISIHSCNGADWWVWRRHFSALAFFFLKSCSFCSVMIWTGLHIKISLCMHITKIIVQLSPHKENFVFFFLFSQFCLLWHSARMAKDYDFWKVCFKLDKMKLQHSKLEICLLFCNKCFLGGWFFRDITWSSKLTPFIWACAIYFLWGFLKYKDLKQPLGRSKRENHWLKGGLTIDTKLCINYCFQQCTAVNSYHIKDIILKIAFSTNFNEINSFSSNFMVLSLLFSKLIIQLCCTYIFNQGI